MHNVESPNISSNKHSEAPQHSDWAEMTRLETGLDAVAESVYRQRQVAKETKEEWLVQ